MNLSEIFKGNNGLLSSKRVIGTMCIVYSMLLCAVAFFVSGSIDIPPNVQAVSLQFLVAGAGMITAGVVEKKGV